LAAALEYRADKQKNPYFCAFFCVRAGLDFAVPGRCPAFSVWAGGAVPDGDSPLSIGLGFVAASCGLLSIVIGATGILFGQRKQEWLHNRFMGERIRQFHFQSFIVQFPEIRGFLLKGDKANKLRSKFRSDRRRLFKQFIDEFEGKLDGKFNSVIGPYGEKDFWLTSSVGTGLTNVAGHPVGGSASQVADIDIEIVDEETRSSGGNGRIHSQELNLFFEAYLHLRISHQVGYANYKLGNDHKYFSALPTRQAEILDAISKAGITWLFLIHAVVFVIAVIAGIGLLVGSKTGISAAPVSYVFSLAIVVIAFMGLVVRAFEQGLQPEREIERYQQYRSAVQSVLERFEKAETVVEKLNSMRQMERVAFDEMRNFLLTSDRSSFVV
jgi:hypothetical protein